jgi:hypothetical protein
MADGAAMIDAENKALEAAKAREKLMKKERLADQRASRGKKKGKTKPATE